MTSSIPGSIEKLVEKSRDELRQIPILVGVIYQWRGAETSVIW
jgi:hypothetical protein